MSFKSESASNIGVFCLKLGFNEIEVNVNDQQLFLQVNVGYR